MKECPSYLTPYQAVWQTDPRRANLDWFADAKYGLFLHYGLYSLLHKHEWVQFLEKIPVDTYEKLSGEFTAHNFDAEAITDLALQAGMRYINLTTCHHEGFCLWDSSVESFNSYNACGRDLVGELSEACHRKGLGFFAYYTFMLHWRHPYFVSRETFGSARPDYETPENRYRYREKEDFQIYIAYIQQVMDELLTKYKITGLWLDLISSWYVLGEEFIPIEEIYDTIRQKHPHVLLSWKTGATGTEDFASPEHHLENNREEIRAQYGDAAAERVLRGYLGNKDKHNEICSTIQRGCWSYNPLAESRSVEELYGLLGYANAQRCNLLLNTGLMADGSIHPRQQAILLGIKEKIDREGFPADGRSNHASLNIQLV